VPDITERDVVMDQDDEQLQAYRAKAEVKVKAEDREDESIVVQPPQEKPKTRRSDAGARDLSTAKTKAETQKGSANDKSTRDKKTEPKVKAEAFGFPQRSR
jgi:hypothetical protein